MESFTTLAHPEPEKIDLGVSVKWASSKISATAPADYGKYYSWGERKTKLSYSWESYLWSEDDVASSELGGSWRIPAVEEFNELVSCCHWQWSENYRDSGVKGYVVYKAKTDGAAYSLDNDVHIFLPAAGYASKDEFYDIGSNGNYWTSSLSAAGFRCEERIMGDKGYVVMGYYRSSSLYSEVAPSYGGGTPNYAVDMCFNVFFTDAGDYYERCFAMPVRAVAD